LFSLQRPVAILPSPLHLRTMLLAGGGQMQRQQRAQDYA
jgi:hypothetical protein